MMYAARRLYTDLLFCAVGRFLLYFFFKSCILPDCVRNENL